MRKRSRRILAAFGILVVVLGVTYAVLMVRATIELRRAYAALEAEGRPMRAAEILPAKVPDSQNAMVLYRSAILMLKGQPAGDESLFESLTAQGSKQRRQAEEEWLGHEAVTRALSLVEQGTRRPACQLEHDNNDALEVVAPGPLDDLRKLASILMARARHEAKAGNAAAAWNLILTELRFADSLRSDPMSATQFARLTLAIWAARMTQQLCETAPPEPECAGTIDELLKRQEHVDPLIRAVDGERLLIGEWFFNLPREELDKILAKDRDDNRIVPEAIQRISHRLSFTMIAFKPRLIADHAAYVQVMRKRIQVLQAPYRSMEEVRKFMQQSRWDFLTDKLTWWSGHDKWFYTGALVHYRMTRAGLALLQYKLAHGAFPETLDALGVEGLIDPFVDKPLHYRAEGDGFLVYSVGEDQKDNGGTPMPPFDSDNPRRRNVEYDVFWRFPNPENQPSEEAEQG